MMKISGIDEMRDTEQEAQERRGRTKEHARRLAWLRVVLLFVVVLAGIFFSWIYPNVAAVARDEADWDLGGLDVIIARVVISGVFAAVTFIPIYHKINEETKKQSATESWAPWLIAFQTGFFWQALFDGISVNSGQLTTPEPGSAATIFLALFHAATSLIP